MNNVWVCITAKDEAETIGPLVEQLLAGQHNVLVVDDGSRDDTGTLARRAGALEMRHGKSEGIGPSLMEAWSYVKRRQGAERIVQLDAGGSHDPADLAGLLAVEADLVIGSRFVPGGQYHGRQWRAGCSRLASLVLNLSQRGPWIHDWSSGYRVFSRAAVERLLACRYTATMHGWQIEVLGRARQYGLSVAEAPISYRAGRSSLRWSTVHETILIWQSVLHHMQVYK